MSEVVVGAPAPGFRLPSAQGPELGPADYHDRSSVILWFTKGMICPFCRAQMSQLGRGYAQFQALGTEILEITPTAPAKAALYARQFGLPFPYLCDPDFTVFRAYGLAHRPQSLVQSVSAFVRGATRPIPPSDFPKAPSPLSDLSTVLGDQDMGFFIVDQQSVVRYALSGSYDAPAGGTRAIPSNEEIVQQLQQCAAAGDGE